MGIVEEIWDNVMKFWKNRSSLTDSIGVNIGVYGILYDLAIVGKD